MVKFVQHRKRRNEKTGHMTVHYEDEKSLRESIDKACAGDATEARRWLDILRSSGVNARNPRIDLCPVAKKQ